MGSTFNYLDYKHSSWPGRGGADSGVAMVTASQRKHGDAGLFAPDVIRPRHLDGAVLYLR